MAEASTSAPPIENGSQASEINVSGLDSNHLIKEGSTILVRLPSNEVRSLRIESPIGEKTMNLGKFGSFRQRELVGQPYGLTYEVQADKSLLVVPPKRLEELGRPFVRVF